MRSRWLACLVAAGVGCRDSGTVAVERPATIQRSPSIELASALTPNLALQLQGGLLPVGNGSTQAEIEISAGRAAELATIFARRFGPYNRTIYEKAAGPIDFASLVAGPRVFLVHSPYQPLSAEYAKPSRKAYGSYYVLNMLQSGRPVLSVAVSALAGDVEVRGGRLIPPKYYGNEFIMLPLPPSIEYPITPERAAQLASEATGKRVKSPPLLIGTTDRWAPQYGRWQLALDGTAADTVYVSWDGQVWLGRHRASEHRASLVRERDRASETRSVALRSGVPDELVRYSKGGPQ